MSYTPQQSSAGIQGSPVQSPQGSPVFYRVSTDMNPDHKTLQIQADCSLTYVYSTQQGTPLGVSQAPDGIGPHTATWSFGIPYPAYIIVDVYDAATGVAMGESQIQLFGQDIYQVRVAYPSNNPGASGYIDAMVNGARTTVYGQDYAYISWNEIEVNTRGSGN